MIVFEEMRLENVCNTCLDFLIGPNELKSLKSRWENLGKKLNSLRQVETSLNTFTSENGKNCYKKLVARIVGFSNSCFKSTIKCVRDEVSTALKGNADLVTAGPSKELVLSGRKEKKTHLNPGNRDKVPIEMKESADLVSACPSKELVLSGKKEKKTHLNLGTEEKVSRELKESADMVSAGSSKELVLSVKKEKKTHLDHGTEEKVSVVRKEKSAEMIQTCPSEELVLSGKKEKKTHLNLGTEEKVQRAQKESEEMVSGCPSKELVLSGTKEKKTHLNLGTQEKVSRELKESAEMVSAGHSKDLVLSSKKEKKTHLDPGTQEKVPIVPKESADIVQGCPSKEIVASSKNQKESISYPRTIDKVGDQRILLVLHETQRALLRNNNCKRLVLHGHYGTGKSLLLRQKAFELAAQGEKVAFYVGNQSRATKFYALTKQDFENTKVKFMEKPQNQNYCLADIIEMHHNGYHIFWDECIITTDIQRSKVKMHLDSTKGYFWIAVSRYQSINSFGDQIVNFDSTFKKVELKVCFRNSPAIQLFETLFLNRSIEAIKKNPIPQQFGDLPGISHETN